MRRVGVREFKEKATTLISEEKAVVIEKHGTPVGFYIPILKKDKAKAREASDRLERTIHEVLARTGMTEDELVEFFTEDWEESVYEEGAPSAARD